MKNRILAVDDDPKMTRTIKAGLEASGQFIVRTEDDSTHVLDAAREFLPDVILLDIIMPQLDGSEVAAQLRADEELSLIPVIFVTALVTQVEIALGSFAPGVRIYLPKPIDFKRLLDTISNSIRGRATTRSVNTYGGAGAATRCV